MRNKLPGFHARAAALVLASLLVWQGCSARTTKKGEAEDTRTLKGTIEERLGPPEPVGPLLTRVLSEGSSGLDQEPAAFRSLLSKRAQQYAAAKKGAGRKGSAARDLLEASCKADGQDPFCALLSELESEAAKARARHPSPSGSSSRKDERNIASLLTEGKVDRLARVPERDLRNTIARRQSFDGLETVESQVLARDRCAATALAAALGGKAEEFLPEERFRNHATALYEKASRCPGETETSARATYRLSLLQFWEERCERALPGLEWLAATAEQHDFGSRALFWISECLEKRGDSRGVGAARRILRERYPFSLHNILLQNREPGAMTELSGRPEPEMRFRSAALPAVNGWVTASEALLVAGEKALARQLLRRAGREPGHTEPEFRLYLAVLFHRAGDYIEKFRILTPLFRENPGMASRAGLELYYPHSSVLELPGLPTDPSRELDRLLVLSLIRQESAFNRGARSPAGALGLMQVMPSTARRIERVRPSQLLDPSVNLRIGSKYLATLARQFNGDAELALAAYNAGPRRVESWLRRYPVGNRLLFIDLIPFKETREYVAAIARNYFWYSVLYPEGVMDASIDDRLVFRVFENRS